ncbi:hypothetical protein PIB30_044197 [Stylosanthes scabra]|uniref:Uncharacterized protein n=1 Tax=Stylosanthes scabra TaxID=79078 RepID=A0ABU6RGH8_9FABA|nr:hypothetical protein [Stylosanthes scabra]
MKAGRTVDLVRIISISREKIGIGRLIHPSKIALGGQIIEKLLERVETMRYHITTQFWVLTGLEELHTQMMRLSQHLGQRQKSIILIRIRIIERLLRQSSKK